MGTYVYVYGCGHRTPITIACGVYELRSMDDRISQLQSMFPSIEGDVIGVVLNESDNNGGSALQKS